MPGRFYGRRRRSFAPRAVINSIKNVHVFQGAVTTTDRTDVLAKAVTAPSPTVTSDVSHGCIIKAVWIAINCEGTGANSVLNTFDAYLIKNPGANLTLPDPIAVGSSNEKKFVFKQWRFMLGNTDNGSPINHWEGWIKIPKRYQRFGTDDILDLVTVAGVTANFCGQAIYKWYR